MCLPSGARAQLAIDRLWVDFDAKTANRADVVIRNESKDRYYISVIPSEIVLPGATDEKRVEMADPEKLGLLVTPNRLVVEPGATRSIRLVSLNGELTTDRVYRVKVTPQVGDIVVAEAAANTRGLAVKVLAAYDVLVTVRPKGGKAAIVATRTGSELSLRNAGTSNVLLYDGLGCNAGEASDTKCEKIGSRRLYPGNEWKITLADPAERVKFKQRLTIIGEPNEVTF